MQENVRIWTFLKHIQAVSNWSVGISVGLARTPSLWISNLTVPFNRSLCECVLDESNQF